MTEITHAGLKPLAGVDGDPVFDEPWQAQALAIADCLQQRGLFSAKAWSTALGHALAEARARNEVDNHGTYYQCVLVALEAMVASNSDISSQAMAQKRKDWESAYHATPHGQPVELKSRR